MARILIIEDDPADAELVLEMLRPHHEGVVESNIEDGIQRLNDGGFDAVILDLSLPDSAGIESVATTHVFDSQTPIIVLTGLDDDAAAMEALRAGAHAYLVKGRTDSTKLQRALDQAYKRAAVEARMPQRHGESVARGVLVPPGAGTVAALAQHLADTPGCLYVAADRPAAVVRRALQSRGVSGIRTVDAADDPERLAVQVEEAVADASTSLVLVDNFNSLMLKHGVDAAALLLHTVANRLRLLGVAVDFVVYDNQEWPFIADRLSFLDSFTDIAPERPSDPSFA